MTSEAAWGNNSHSLFLEESPEYLPISSFLVVVELVWSVTWIRHSGELFSLFSLAAHSPWSFCPPRHHYLVWAERRFTKMRVYHITQRSSQIILIIPVKNGLIAMVCHQGGGDKVKK